MTAAALPATDTKRVIAPWQTKVVDDEARTFEGLSATWDMDLGDDVIHPGAFKKAIREWKASGQVKHLLDCHNQFTIRAALGKLVDAREEKAGLWSKWQVIPGDDGDEALHRLRAGVIDSMSIGYKPLKFDEESDEDARFGVRRNLRELEWRESSLVIFPMNPAALIDTASVKALIGQGLQTKALPAEQLDALKELHATLGTLLAPASKVTPPPDEPDYVSDAVLDGLRLRRLRSRTASLRGDLTITP